MRHLLTALNIRVACSIRPEGKRSQSERSPGTKKKKEPSKSSQAKIETYCNSIEPVKYKNGLK